MESVRWAAATRKICGASFPTRNWSQLRMHWKSARVKVAAELEIEKSFGSLEAMLECKGIDAVVIATPDKFHAPAVSLAAAAGKAMLCEKPLALNLADARASLAAVAKHKVYFQVGFMRRYDPAYSAAMKRIEAGEIGVPVVFKSLGRDKEGPPLSYYHSQINGMLFYTNTIHDFDLARWMVQDEVTEVHAFTTAAIRPEVTQFGDVVASVVNLKFAKGAIGNIESHAQAHTATTSAPKSSAPKAPSRSEASIALRRLS